MPATSLPVEYLFTIHIKVGTRRVIEGGPNGTRHIYPVTGGTFEGPRLRGTVPAAPGGDWATQRPDGTIDVDVRMLLETDDGALIFMRYLGVVFSKGDVRAIRTAPRFETGDPRYAWLNNLQAVGLGGAGDGGPVYEIYSLL
jgi:hypothetical protein